MTDQIHSPFNALSSVPFLDISVFFEASGRIAISGFADGFANGTEVGILILDTQGNSTTVTAIVQDGAFELRNLDERVFTPGNLTITASAGNAMAQETLVLAAKPDTAPIVIDEQPLLNALNQLSIRGKAPSLEPGDEVKLVIRDVNGTSVTATAAVQSDGRFSVQGISTQGLIDGTLFIDVMAQTDTGTISVMNAANLELVIPRPEGADKTLALNEDTPLALSAADFGYDNSDGFNLTGIKVAGLPGAGRLQLNGVDVVMDDFVSVAQLNAGQLLYRPPLNANGNALANFKFKVMDDRPLNNEDREANTITFNVTPVNDAPVVDNLIPDQVATYNAPFSYTIPANTFSDVDSTLTYSATLGSDAALPAWLTFNAATRTFSGTPPNALDINLKVIASDGTNSVSDVFRVAIAPAVTSLAVVSATGVLNDRLNAGDVATIEVNFIEAVTVTGTPQLALNIGGTLVQANYVSGSGGTTLTFTYTVQVGQNDPNGISIDPNALTLNGGTIRDVHGNNAILNTPAVIDNPSFRVDTVNLRTVSADGMDKNFSLADDTSNTWAVYSDGTTKGRNLYVTVAGTEALQKAQMRLDGGAWTDMTLSGNKAVFHFETALTTGGHAFDFRTLDLAGNFSAITTQNVSVSSWGSLPNVTTVTAATVSVPNSSTGQALLGNGNVQTFTVSKEAIGSYLNNGAANLFLQGGTTGDAGSGTVVDHLNMTGDGAVLNLTDLLGGGYTVDKIQGFEFLDMRASGKQAIVADAISLGSVSTSGWLSNSNLLPGYYAMVVRGGPEDTLVINRGGAHDFTGFVAAGTSTNAGNFIADGFTYNIFRNDTTLQYLLVQQGVQVSIWRPTAVGAPVNIVPLSVTALQETTKAITDISVEDINGNLSRVQLSVLNGTVSVSLSGTTVSAGALNSSSVTLIGTQAQLNAALATLTYKGDAAFSGTDTLTIVSTDNTGTPLSDTDTVAITVTAVNDAPVNTLPAQTPGTEDTDKVITGLSVSDSDGNTNLTVTLAITNGTLTLLPGAGVTLTGNNTASVQLSGTLSAVNALLATANAVTYKPTANYNGSAQLTMTSSDGTLSDTDTVALTVNSVNDAPTGANKTITMLEDGSRTLAAVDFGFADAADTPANSLSAVIITALPAAGTLTLGGSPVTLNQSIPAASLGNLVYTPAANGNGTGYATIGFKVQDNGGTANGGQNTSVNANANTLTFNVTAVNDAPVNTVPGSQTTNENANKVITGLSVIDVDAGANPMTVTLAVTNGTLTLLTGTGVTLTGNNSTSVQLSGTLSAINTLLATANAVTYKPTANFNGSAVLTMTSSDGTLSDSDTVTISVRPEGFRGNAQSQLGYEVSNLGDVNGDGFEDVIIGAPGTNGAASSAYVLYGNAAGEGISLTGGTIALSRGFKISGVGDDETGHSVSSAGDINGDGFNDILVGSYGRDAGGGTVSEGATFIIYGGASGNHVNLSNFQASQGVRITGADNERSGHSVSNAGDVNGDGLNDIIVGAIISGQPEEIGAAYVIYGRTSGMDINLFNNTTLDPSRGFKLVGVTGSDGATIIGNAVSSAGDFNGDGFSDVILGAANHNDAYIIFGGPNGQTGGDVISLVNSGQGVHINGLAADIGLGSRVTGLGDFNGDGFADVAMVGNNADSNSVARIIYGRSTSGTINVSSAASATSGFGLSASISTGVGDRIDKISGAGDMNGDGLADLMVAGFNLANYQGWTYVVYGSTNASNLALNGPIAASRGFMLQGTFMGEGISTAGDFNGDGLDDLILGFGSNANVDSIGGYSIVLGGTQWVSSAIKGSGAVNGTASNEVIVGSDGNDTLVGGGGVDRFYAGKGNDTLVLTASDVTALAATTGAVRALVDGGTGYDTLRLSGGANLNLAGISNVGASGFEEQSRLESIERIDLATDTAANTLTLSARDVNDMAGFNQIRTGSVSADGKTWTNVSGTALAATTRFHQLVVDGSANDQMLLLAPGQWAAVGTVNDGTHNYVVHQNSATQSQVIVRQGVGVTVDEAPVLIGSNPSDNGFMTAVGNNIILNFNEAVVQGVGTIELFRANGTLVQSFNTATSPLVTGWGTANLTINPTNNLLANTGYYIRIAPAAVKDTAGNAYAGITDNTTLNFTTADASGAIVVPVNGVTAIEDLSTIGDFNGDGYDDFIVGAGMNGLSSTDGAAFVVYGNANGTVPNLSGGTIAASAGFKIVSGLTGDYFGIAVNSAGDTNGDGLADLVVTAKYGDASYRESAYVIFGKSNASTVFATGLNVGTGLTASMGYQIKLDESYWGQAVSNAGDVNGDGLSDLLVISDTSAARNVYVIYGKTGNQSVTLTSYTQFTPDMGYNVLTSNVIDLGQSVYGAGDVNGDGLADFIVGAPNSSTGARGMAYVVYGNSTGTSVQLNATDGIAPSQGFRIHGQTGNNTSYSYFGFAVSSAGDVNGDGLADVMISSPHQPGTAGGAVYVVYGNSSGNVLDIDLESSSGAIAASRGFRISSAVATDILGRHSKDIASAGDINGDGLSDMIIGGRDENGYSTASTYVVYGNASGTNVAIDASGNIAASKGFKLKGAVGFVVASAGDINGDGLNDLLVSARLGGNSGSYNVVLGGTQWVTAALDGAGTFAGTSGDEALIGSAGNDTITGGGGVDRFFAGRGDDTIVLTASDIANLQNNSTGQTAKTTVSAGTGFDTIRLSGGAGLDLLKVSNAAAMGIDETSRIEGIERIDMATDTAANTLKISNKDINDMAGFNQIRIGSASADGKTWTNLNGGTALAATTRFHQMVIDGGSNDTVALTANGGAWAIVGTVSNGTTQYTVYQNTATHSQLLVQQGVTVDTQAPTLLWSTPADNDFVLTANLGNNITLQFSEAVVKGNGYIQLWNKTTGQPVEAFDVNTSTLVTGWGTSTLTINPTANLAAKTDYFIKVSDNAIQDNAGLAYSGMNSDLPLNFSTQSADGSFAVTSSFKSASDTNAYLRSVATAGDFNGDGYDDLLIGAAGSSQSGVYVIYGNAQGEGLNLDKDPVMSNGMIAADQGFKIQGRDYFGTSVSGIGDVNGDGFADILIGASSDSQGGSNAGAAFVVYGSADPAALNLSSGSIAAARGFKIAAGTGYGSMGNSVSGVDDFNGDGIGDFIIGYASSELTKSGGGEAYVVYGKTNASSLSFGTNGSMAAADGIRLSGAVSDRAGFSVSGAGDVNGDGLSDVIVSASGALSNADGAAYVIFGGATGGDMDALVAAGKGLKITGLTNNTGHHLGTSVSSAGDVNGDGYADLIVGTDTDQAYSAAFVVYGGPTSASVSLSAGTIAASQGFRILGNSANGAGLSQVSGAGDLNGDGFADVIVGSTGGSSYVVYGKATGAEVSVSTGTIAASQGFKLTYSTNLTSTTANDVSFAGDFDGDGLNDLVIAESTNFGNSQTYKIVFGGTQWLTTPVIGNGAVTGTAASEAILGSTANDTLTGGGGVDRFFAGMGDDTIVLTANDVANLGNVAAGQTAKASVNGGGGFDSIRMSGGVNLFLPSISNAGAMGLEENSRIESIERIDMATDTASNTLTLQARDVRDMAGMNLIQIGSVSADGKTWTNVTGTALSVTTKFHQFVVDGGSNDNLTLGTDLGFWSVAGTVNNGTHNYTVYQNTGGNAQVLVRAGVVVTNNDSVAPVVLDLNRDGDLSYSQTLMDVNNDGQLDQTAWAAAQDGVLVWDKYMDGAVHDNSQYAFAQYAGFAGATDLQGLAEAFDNNADGLFSSLDAMYSQFAVWQDLDQDGVSDEGEVRSLADWGVVAINLVSDGLVQAPAVGVQESGRSAAQMADGSEMVVADAAFAYQTVPQLDLAGFVAQVQAESKSQPLPTQASVKLFLYDMIQGAHDAALPESDLFSAAEPFAAIPDSFVAMGAMNLLAEQLLTQPAQG